MASYRGVPKSQFRRRFKLGLMVGIGEVALVFVLLAFISSDAAVAVIGAGIIATVLIWAWIMYRLWHPLRTEEDEA